MRRLAILVVLAACSHGARPAHPTACGAGWAPLTDTTAAGGAAPFEHAPDAVIRSVAIEGVPGELAATLRSVIATRADQRFADAPLKEDLRRLWALGVIEDGSIEARGDALVFVVAPRRRVASVELHAADRDVVRRFALLPGASFEPRRLARMASAIEETFVREGRLDAKVTVARARRAGGVGVCVAVDPGPKVTIASVTFPGRRAVPEAVLRAAMPGDKKGINKVGGIYDADGMNVAELYVSAAYWDRGFANVHVGSHRVVRKGKRLVVELPIEEGPTFRIGRIATPGVRAPKLPVKPGDLFSRTRISDARELLSKELGVEVYPMTQIDVARRTIDITFKPEWRWPWDAFKRWPSLLR